MPTVITRFVDAAGGFDYTLPSLAVAAFPSNFVTADEQWEVGIYKTAGGYSDGFDMPSCTTDATRYPRMYAVSGDEYDRATDTGVYLTATRNFDGVITNLTIPYLRLEGIGFKNSGLSSARGFLSSANNCTYTNLYATTADAYQVFDFTAGNACSASGLLSEDGTIGCNFGSFAEYDCNNITVIDPSSTGYSKTGASRVTELINCLHIDGAGGGSVWGSGTFAGSTDYNATSDSTTPTGANSLANRTTADLVNYASNDYRTASASALATAGDGVLAAYIGFDLEVSGGITITGGTTSFSYSAINADIELAGEITITGGTTSYTYSAISGEIDLTGSVDIVGATTNYTYSAVNAFISLTPTINIEGGTTSYTYSAVPATIDFTGNINITGGTTSYSYAAIGADISLQGEIPITGSTTSYSYSAVNATISLIGVVDVPNWRKVRASGINIRNIKVTGVSNPKSIKVTR